MSRVPATLSLLVLIACGTTPEGEADGGTDGGVAAIDASSLDASVDAQSSDDGGLDGGPDAALDPASCEGYGRGWCAFMRECYPLMWFPGCDEHFTAQCLETDELEDTGDLRAWRAACVTTNDCSDVARLLFGTSYGSLHPCNEVVLGARGVGEPCGHNVQCGEGMMPDGRTVPLHCWRPDVVAPICEQGVCSLPLGEGEGPCVSTETRDRCDKGLGLDCVNGGSSSTCWLATETGHAPREVGEACEHYWNCRTQFCAADGTCALALFEGEACDPADDRCHRGTEVACDATSRVCTHVDVFAFPGDPCDASLECVGSTCTDGVCVTRPRGSCWCRPGWMCVDDVCQREPCPSDEPDAGP